ncbi:hypothetical protein GCM10010435_12710 [Winogradskya consettensis]|uniref:Uncharacterized protein n=1 Tax=Winogradskya consettensis TaxID=113560 RepID=A0A919VMC0_9ACTN|nr:hypothetical protein Aco04nite_11970 [Actinoplanes consettensis]
MQHREEKRAWWRRVLVLRRRRYTCGLPWPCIEAWMAKGKESGEFRALTALSDSGKSGDSHRPDVPSWQTNTMPLFQIGRTGALTPAQKRRSRGGA